MYHGELVCLVRQTCNCAEPDGRTTITCCCGENQALTLGFERDEEKEMFDATAVLLLTGGRRATVQMPPWQAAVYTGQARRPRVLVEPSESLGIRSCCELNGGNQWKSGWVGHRRACWLAQGSSHQPARGQGRAAAVGGK